MNDSVESLFRRTFFYPPCAFFFDLATRRFGSGKHADRLHRVTLPPHLPCDTATHTFPYDTAACQGGKHDDGLHRVTLPPHLALYVFTGSHPQRSASYLVVAAAMRDPLGICARPPVHVRRDFITSL